MADETESRVFIRNTRAVMDMRDRSSRAIIHRILPELDDVEKRVFSSVDLSDSDSDPLRRWLVAGVQQWGLLPATAAFRRLERAKALLAIGSGPRAAKTPAPVVPSIPRALLDAINPSGRIPLSIMFVIAAMFVLHIPFSGNQPLAVTYSGLSFSNGFSLFLSSLAASLLFATLAPVPFLIPRRLRAVRTRNATSAPLVPDHVMKAYRDEADAVLSSSGLGFFGGSFDDAALAIARSASQHNTVPFGSKPEELLQQRLSSQISASIVDKALFASVDDAVLFSDVRPAGTPSDAPDGAPSL